MRTRALVHMPPSPETPASSTGAARRLLGAVILGLTVWTTAEAQRTFNIAPVGIDPKISADGKWVAFHIWNAPDGITLARPDGSQLRSTGVDMGYKLAVSGDGGLVAYDYLAQVYVLDTRTLQITQVSGAYPAYLPDISADGSTVAFVSEEYFQEFAAVNADGTSMRHVAPGIRWLQCSPSLTADGSLMAFEGFDPDVYPFEYHVYSAATDGSPPLQLTTDPNITHLRARISEDGSRLTYEDFRGDLHVVDPDGSNHLQLTSGMSISFLGEGVDFSAINADGTVAAFNSWNRIFVVRTDGTGLRQLGAGRELDISGRGDFVAYNSGGAIVATAVPGVSPGEMADAEIAPDGSTISWSTSPSANSHNLYRVAIPSPGAATPGASGSCLADSIPGASSPVPDDPPAGEAFGYYVTGENGWGEGTAGLTAGGPERLPALSCPPVDSDGDALPDFEDTCPLAVDPADADSDGDGLGDLCDNCPTVPNEDQMDLDNDGIGDGVIPSVEVLFPNGGEILAIGSAATLQWSATEICDPAVPVDLLLSRDGPGGPYEILAQGVANTGSFDWTVTGPQVNGPRAHLRVVVRDSGPTTGQDDSDAGFRIQ